MCQAIKYHTIGNINMNTFDKIIFIADKIGRKNLDSFMEKVKEKVYLGYLDQAIIMYFESLNNKLASQNLSMHPNSLKLVQLLKEKTIKVTHF